MCFSCTDNGSGINAECLKEIQKILASDEGDGKHIGLYNVHIRIVMEYGPEYGTKIFSEESKGTRVKITIPVKSGKK